MLSVMIVKDPGVFPAATTRYKLKAEEVLHGQNRTLISTALPGGTVLQIDMGRTLQVVSVSGICDETGTDNTDTDSIAIADHDNILEINDWWGDTIRLYTRYVDSVVEANNDYFEGKITRVEVKKVPYKPYYQFKLDLTAETANIA